MDKTFEVEVVQVEGGCVASSVSACVTRTGTQIGLSVSTGSTYYFWSLLPSEAVTIGEQLIAAGKAGEV